MVIDERTTQVKPVRNSFIPKMVLSQMNVPKVDIQNEPYLVNFSKMSTFPKIGTTVPTM
jgi:hypothetical protein